MTDFPWLTTLGAVPLVGALVVAALPRTRDLLAKQVALGFSLVVLALTVVLALRFEPNSEEQFQFAETHEWIPQFGVSYAVGVDGIALGADRPGDGAHADLHPGLVARRLPPASPGRHLLLAVPAARDAHDRRVRGDRRVPVLRLLRGDADPDVLHHRVLRGPAAFLRSGEVPALQPVRRPADAGGGDRPVRRVRRRQPGVPVREPARPGHRTEHRAMAVPRLLRRLRHQGAAVAGAHVAARRSG